MIVEGYGVFNSDKKMLAWFADAYTAECFIDDNVTLQYVLSPTLILVNLAAAVPNISENKASEVYNSKEPAHTISTSMKPKQEELEDLFRVEESTEAAEVRAPRTGIEWLHLNPLKKYMDVQLIGSVVMRDLLKPYFDISTFRIQQLVTGFEVPTRNEYCALRNIIAPKGNWQDLRNEWENWLALMPYDLYERTCPENNK